MPLAVLGVVAPSVDSEAGAETASSCLIVEVEVERLLKPLVKGERCVSFSSAPCQTVFLLDSNRLALTHFWSISTTFCKVVSVSSQVLELFLAVHRLDLQTRKSNRKLYSRWDEKEGGSVLISSLTQLFTPLLDSIFSPGPASNEVYRGL